MHQGNFTTNAEIKIIGGDEKSLNSIGRALNLIHEGVHANMMHGASLSVLANQNVQHSHMADNHVETIFNALKEFSPNLTDEQASLLSITGLINDFEDKDQVALLAAYSKEYWGVEFKVDDKKTYNAAFDKAKEKRDEIIYD